MFEKGHYMSLSVVAGDAPDGRGGLPIYVRRLKAAERVDVIIISPTVSGVWTHFAHKRTVLCGGSVHQHVVDGVTIDSRSASACGMCAAGVPCRWHGYVHVASLPMLGDYILELTEVTWEQLRRTLSADRNIESLRGVKVGLRRGRSRAARVEVLYADVHELTEETIRSWGVPVNVDVVSVVRRLLFMD